MGEFRWDTGWIYLLAFGEGAANVLMGLSLVDIHASVQASYSRGLEVECHTYVTYCMF
jgi:hypothetical protein